MPLTHSHTHHTTRSRRVCRFLHFIRMHKELQSATGAGGKHDSVRAIALYPPQGMIFYSEGSRVKVREGFGRRAQAGGPC